MNEVNKTNGNWQFITELIEEKKFDEALNLCMSEPYSNLLECQRYVGWEYYEQNELKLAEQWFSYGASKDDSESFFGLGCVYYKQGHYVAALSNFIRSADGNYRRANHWIGYMYEFGLGTSEDDQEALNYYKKGAQFRYVRARMAVLRLKKKRGGIYARKIVSIKIALLLLHTFIIGLKNVDDDRLIDIPDAFKNIQR